MSASVTLVKLGGSLITKKRVPDTARPDVIAALAAQLEAAARGGAALIVGHGSGSFGHTAAIRAGITGVAGSVEPLALPPDPAGISRVQAKASELHRIVVNALLRAGARPFSIAPSAVATATAGAITRVSCDTVEAALEGGLMPVVYGDVVLDPGGRASIVSTESVLVALAGELRRSGRIVRRCLWLGDTDGVLGPGGGVVAQVPARAPNDVLAAVGASIAPDVTGGMRHRVETALVLARSGIPSWIGNGRRPAALQRLLADEHVPGTEVVP